MKSVKKALCELGFLEKNGYFQHKDCQWFVEFVSGPVAVGNESVQEFNQLGTTLGTIKLLHPIDTVKDRLSKYYHWNDKEGLMQAVSICLEQQIDFQEIERWSSQEKQENKFKNFMSLFKQISGT